MGGTTAAYVIGAIVSAFSAVKQEERYTEQKKTQEKIAEEEAGAQAKALKEEKASALARRKLLIDKQRRELIGKGAVGRQGQTAPYTINPTGGTGVINPGAPAPTITGSILG